MDTVTTQDGRPLEDPPAIRFLFMDVRAAWIWLPLRLAAGLTWLEGGIAKVNGPGWLDGGEALRAYWAGAVRAPSPAGQLSIVFDAYRGMIEVLLNLGVYTWVGPAIAFGELVIGVALIVGAFTGVAALIGGFMNWTLLMAGTATTNGLLFAVSVGLILAWRISGFIGADYVLLAKLGTPWGARPARKPPVEPAL